MAYSKMEITEKVLSCHGNVNAKSTAKMCGISIARVYGILHYHGLKVSRSDQHRSSIQFKT